MIHNKLSKEGFRFIRIRKNNKIPIDDNWQDYNNFPYDSLEIKNHLLSGGNIGIVCGFNNLLVIDFDNQQFQDKYVPLFPKTLMQKSGGGLTHLFYIVDKPISTKLFDSKKNTLCDIQGQGKQIIISPSIHPNGNKYEFINNEEIAYIEIAEIKKIFQKYFNTHNTKINEGLIKPDLKQTLREYGVDVSKNNTRCPWHNSKGGKCFSFEEKKQVWHCFHCDKGGDVISFVMENDGLDFIDACKKLNIETNTGKVNVGFYNIDNYIKNVEEYYKIQPFFYDKSGLFWFWQEQFFRYDLVDDIDLMNGIDDSLNFQGLTVNGKLKSHYIEAFKRVGRKMKPKDAPIKWVQFRDKAYSLTSGEVYDVKPNYFFTNPIPWELGETSETPTIDKLFTDWVGEENKIGLYELISYCCYSSYPIQLIFCLYGHGRNGKSQFIKILNKFFGLNNICSTELDTLIDRPNETFKLYKKLICSMGETNFGTMKKTSLLKKLVGGDLIGYERKYSDPFDGINYAKIIIASNSLPSSDDTSDGFMRRWHIIDFPNEFTESGKDIIETIPDHEYNNLARKVVELLPKLLKKGVFTNQGSIEQRKKKYISVSNPLSLFIEESCTFDESAFIEYNKLYTEYVKYLIKHKKRKVKSSEFRDAIENEGYYIEKTSKKIGESFVNGRFINGLKLNCDNCDFCATNPIKFSYKKTLGEQEHNCHNCHKIDEKEDKMLDIYYILQKKAQDINVNIQNMVEMGVSEQEIQENLRLGNYAECKKGFIQKI